MADLHSPAPGRLMVLRYQAVHDSRQSRGRFHSRQSVHPERFREQMELLRELGVAGWLPAAGEPLLAPPGPADRNMVLITFDGNDASLTEVALPILSELGLGAIFFIACDQLGQRGMISRRGLQELTDAGMGIGSHGHGMRPLTSLADTALEVDLVSSRLFLEDRIGRPVVWLSLPGGRGGARELGCAFDAGYRAVLGSTPGDNRLTRPDSVIDRVGITRGLGLAGFRQVLDWRGSVSWRLSMQHRLTRMPTRLLGPVGSNGGQH